MYIESLPDGCINIKETSDKNTWFPIGQIDLKPDEYVFSGLSDVDKNTVGLVLETDNNRIIDDVGPVDEVTFELLEGTDIKAYVIVYIGFNCDSYAGNI